MKFDIQQYAEYKGKREYHLLIDLLWLEQSDEWKGLNALRCAKSTVMENDEVREFTRYFITSLTDLEIFVGSVTKYWSIEKPASLVLQCYFS